MQDINPYLAHSPTDAHPEGQSLQDHLENVAQLSASFSRPFGGEQDGFAAGRYHDIGKFSDPFQRRVRGGAEKADHSSAGALLLFEKRNLPASMCIAGHHSGLMDAGTRNDLSGTFMARIQNAKVGGIADCSAWQQFIPPPSSADSRRFPGLGNYFYIKMLFSSLTDADWLDTEAYFQNTPYRPSTTDFQHLQELLDKRLAEFGPPQTELAQRRNTILRAAQEHAEDAPGLFSMTVPTGGGKTLSSMAFALRHALQHGLRRVIYVIPYCSILEQTQAVFEEIFGKEPILAHYSGAEYEHPETGEDRRAFSAENWDAPVILTTAVQFFESLYANKPGKVRKLHNIANSVIVFDEAQMLPVPFLKPCLAGICQLVENFGCSAVLCTATQPAVEPLLRQFLPNRPIREICPDPKQMYLDLRRVTYVDDGSLSDEAVVSQLRRRRQVLCVVNSRRQAQELYRALGEGEGSFHLSTTMIPADRKRILQEIRARLRNGQDCRVISTSLIEAGVDVDFPEVYRAIAGLDSIIQAGGRCNREGRRPREDSLVHIFRTEARAPRMLEQNISAASRTLRRTDQADSPEAIRDYFQ
ncbi:MAG: CRISPR-associated helicase Cas3', partial [Oscillospiraceae bacterium]|nr:CRISPR-associated helicase Cas3' [Oscillospiraceae bacterium]